MPSRTRRLAAPLFSLALAACAGDDGDRLSLGSRIETESAFAQTLPYTVTIEGVEDELRDVLESTSTLVELREDPPQGRLGLRRRADADVERLLTALRSEGYHGAQVDIRIGEGEPVPVTIAVDPGPRYGFVAPVVVRVGPGEEPVDPALLRATDLGIEDGAPAEGRLVVAATDALLARLQEAGYPFPAIEQRRVIVDHGRRTVAVEFDLDPGRRARLGPIVVSGLDDVELSYVRNRVPWEPGELYHPDLLERFRDALASRPVFSNIRVTPAEEIGPDGTLPVNVVLAERPARFVGFGAEYASQTGFGVNAYWGHRNLLGGAERLRVEAEVNRIGEEPINRIAGLDYTLGVEFEKPDFLAVDQVLELDGSIVLEHPEAYERRAVTASAVVSRQLTDEWRAGVGVTLERAYFSGQTTNQNTALVGIPLTTSYDSSDDALDPTRGIRASAALTPYYDLFGTGFTTLRLNGSTYLGLGEEDRVVLAARVGTGATLGGATAVIPPDKRFYGGGGGSVRGYGFQRLGPLDERGNPMGGRSLIELGLEARVRVGENWGVVPFVDAGAVSSGYFSDLLDRVRIGAGLGLRYYTAIGPIRLDLAVPFDPRPQDSRYQIYLSLGQAF